MPDMRISNLLNEIRLLLEFYAVEPWRHRIAQLADDAARVYQNESGWARQNLLEELTELFGGMGSFNDLVISAQNGDRIDRDQEPEANKRLNELRERLYEALEEDKPKS
jgi:hypothetical protein